MIEECIQNVLDYFVEDYILGELFIFCRENIIFLFGHSHTHMYVYI